MGAAYFYHLTQKPLEVTLPMLLAGMAEKLSHSIGKQSTLLLTKD